MAVYAYAAVVTEDDGSRSLIGTCAVAAGAAAFAVSCGAANARVVKIPQGIADAIADIVFAKCEDLTAEDINEIAAAVERANEVNATIDASVSTLAMDAVAAMMDSTTTPQRGRHLVAVPDLPPLTDASDSVALPSVPIKAGELIAFPGDQGYP